MDMDWIKIAQERGYVDILQRYLELGARRLSEGQQCWCDIMKSAHSPVLIEMFRHKIETCKRNISWVKLSKNPTVSSAASVRVLLHQPGLAQMNSRKKALELSLLYNKPVFKELLDFRDITKDKMVNLFSESGLKKDTKLSDIFDIFTGMCGTELTSIAVTYLLQAIRKLDKDLREEFIHCVRISGVPVKAHRYDDLYLTAITDKDVNEAERAAFLLNELSSRPSPDQVTLQDLCRIKIRRILRQHTQEPISMKDMIVSLYTGQHLTLPVVTYLLFRDFKHSAKAQSTFLNHGFHYLDYFGLEFYHAGGDYCEC